MTVDRTAKLSAHFTLGELIPFDCTEVPLEVQANLAQLCETILEPVRGHFGRPLKVHSGYRTPEHNAEIPGASRSSDHPAGRAADFHLVPHEGELWEPLVEQAFDYIRHVLDGAYGQIILEDHRTALSKPGKLWVHVSIPSPKHPGIVGDPSRVLASDAPGHTRTLA